MGISFFLSFDIYAKNESLIISSILNNTYFISATAG